MYFLKILLTLLIAVCFASYAAASTYVDVGDEIYNILSRLEAEGVITSGLLSTKPLSRSEVIRLLREAEADSEGRSEVVKSLIKSLKQRLDVGDGDRQVKPVDSVYVRYIHMNSDVQALNYNNDGDIYTRGSNLRTGIRSRVEDIGPLSLSLNPEFRLSDTDEYLEIKKAYGVLGFSWLDIIIGKDSQWWGPGYHGSILLSNNAEPFTMVRLTNPHPVVLPWILKHLGPFRFTFFLTNLEKERAVPEPYLWGLRFDFKPHQNFEIGLERTAILGGRGRPEDLDVWLKSLVGIGNIENTGDTTNDPGDQRAGFSFKWNIPSKSQPVQLYLEADGEDEYHNLPNIWAFVGGVYLPRISGFERIDFRAEYGSTRGRRLAPAVWYSHHIYTSYTYYGQIIGHHIGTDSNDIFTEASYLIPEKESRLFLSYDREQHNLRGPGSSEIKHEVNTGMKIAYEQLFSVILSYGHAWIRNMGNVQSETKKINAVTGQIQYRF